MDPAVSLVSRPGTGDLRDLAAGDIPSGGSAYGVKRAGEKLEIDDRVSTARCRNSVSRYLRGVHTRDIDAPLAALREDADWPNVIDGTRAVGHDEVRSYWSRQFREIDSHVEPKRFGVDPEGRVIVDVHQVLRDRDGSLLDDRMVHHVYTVSEGLIVQMDVSPY